MQHDLKTWPVYYDAIIEGRKPFEVRTIEDRMFATGDTLNLREWDKMRYFPRPNDPEADALAIEAAYTGRATVVYVGYVLTQGVTYQGKPAAVLGIFLPRSMQPKAEAWAAQLVKEIEEYGVGDVAAR